MMKQQNVRDHIPLEQGLRHRNGELDRICGMVRDHIPLEQGLRPAEPATPASDEGQRPYSIRTRIKTPHTRNEQANYLLVRDHIPLEQGLRPTRARPLPRPT